MGKTDSQIQEYKNLLEEALRDCTFVAEGSMLNGSDVSEETMNGHCLEPRTHSLECEWCGSPVDNSGYCQNNPPGEKESCWRGKFRQMQREGT